MKWINYFMILICTFSLFGCPWKITVPPETTSEEWIAIIDIDGSNLEYICNSEDGAIPYFVPDLENPEEEIILLSLPNRVEIMNQDGTDRITIIDSVGEVFSFSNDRTKMLLNDEGEIYIANVDGTEFQNLTNTPDIWEKDPSFSPDAEKIVFSYTLSDTHSLLVIKNLATNEDSIVYEYEISSSYQTISFRYPTFQNDDQILYQFYLIDQTEEPHIYRIELHRINIDTNLNEIIFDENDVYTIAYSNIRNLCAINSNYTIILYNLNTMSQDYEFQYNFFVSTIPGFSPQANYFYIGGLIYDFENSYEYHVNTSSNNINQDEIKIVGINRRKFPEDKED